ncbi:Ribonuclease H-like domain [Ceratocystis lukuohia]|uniref:Ribonuclease H-like domain n=1 Tax=Ceratocystis lukuohia TaxID=2019550 RepID=A0ABR4MRP4_9PEZI
MPNHSWKEPPKKNENPLPTPSSDTQQQRPNATTVLIIKQLLQCPAVREAAGAGSLVVVPGAVFDGECGMVGLQTDDTLILSDDDFAQREAAALKEAGFLAKNREELSNSHGLKFNSSPLSMMDDGSLYLSQECQVVNIDTIDNTLKVNRGSRGKLSQPLTCEEQCVAQRARGAYVASVCQSEASFDMSTGAHHTNPDGEQVKALNLRLQWQKDNAGACHPKKDGEDYEVFQKILATLKAVLDSAIQKTLTGSELPTAFQASAWEQAIARWAKNKPRDAKAPSQAPKEGKTPGGKGSRTTLEGVRAEVQKAFSGELRIPDFREYKDEPQVQDLQVAVLNPEIPKTMELLGSGQKNDIQAPPPAQIHLALGYPCHRNTPCRSTTWWRLECYEGTLEDVRAEVQKAFSGELKIPDFREYKDEPQVQDLRVAVLNPERIPKTTELVGNERVVRRMKYKDTHATTVHPAAVQPDGDQSVMKEGTLEDVRAEVQKAFGGELKILDFREYKDEPQGTSEDTHATTVHPAAVQPDGDQSVMKEGMLEDVRAEVQKAFGGELKILDFREYKDEPQGTSEEAYDTAAYPAAFLPGMPMPPPYTLMQAREGGQLHVRAGEFLREEEAGNGGGGGFWEKFMVRNVPRNVHDASENGSEARRTTLEDVRKDIQEAFGGELKILEFREYEGEAQVQDTSV